MTVAAPTKTVKKINTQSRSDVQTARNVQSRSVTTERTASGRTSTNRSQAAYNQRRDHVNGGRSVTINSSNSAIDETDDYEELF